MHRFFFYLFTLACVLSFVFCPSVHAAGEFSADYDVQYTIAPTGSTTVTNVITLTNNLTNLYPKQYTVLIDSLKIKNIIAYDGRGPITPTATQKDGKTEITVVFNEKAVGIGNKLRFTLRYDNGDIAQKVGNIWEVYIPGIAEDPDLGAYIVTLHVPPNFGPNAYLSPKPADGTHWMKDQLVAGGISAAYGESQPFFFNLSYHLANPSVFPVTKSIPLPPQTPYQDISIHDIQPIPKHVEKTADGNWMAVYALGPGQTIDVAAKIEVTVRLFPSKDTGPQSIDSHAYTVPLPFWETNDPSIVSVAQEARTPRHVYDYVVKTLSYDYKKVNEQPTRIGAKAVLASPNRAICTEFTDLFIAVARAAGIPARRAIGYAYTTNPKLRPLSLVSDVLHAWPEYYDTERMLWVAVDPTWADTTGGTNYFDKLDFNHVVFAYNGIASETPYPVGFYKDPKNPGKDIDVSFDVPPLPSERSLFLVDTQIPTKVISGTTTNGTVKIINTSGKVIPKITASVSSQPAFVRVFQEQTEILPYQSLTIPFTFQTPDIFARGQGKIMVNVNDRTAQAYFSMQPLLLIIGIAGSVGVVGIISSIFLIVKYVWPRFKKH